MKIHSSTFSIILLTDMMPNLVWRPWNSLVRCETVYPDVLLCHLPHILKISLKSVYLFFHNVAGKHGSSKHKNQPWVKMVKSIIIKIFQIALCLMSKVSWKFHDNPFYHYSIMLVTDTDSPKIEETHSVFNGLNGTSSKCSRLFLEPSPTIPENFIKICSRICP